MIKKLVKYGNSTALVLDKAILELLGMTEGSSVKISTDGKSLIIAPLVEVTENELINIQPFVEVKTIKNPDATIAEVMKEMHGITDPMKQKAQCQMGMICMQRSTILRRLYANDSFLQELATKHKTDIQGICELMYKHEPELKGIDAQLLEAQAILDPNKNALKCLEEANRAFEFFYTKGSEYFGSFAAAQNNPEYRHELALITEEYERTQDKNAYMAAYKELMQRYMPVMSELLHK
jgi:antitoxin component of MazEF toxin-antitoxin module